MDQWAQSEMLVKLSGREKTLTDALTSWFDIISKTFSKKVIFRLYFTVLSTWKVHKILVYHVTFISFMGTYPLGN